MKQSHSNHSPLSIAAFAMEGAGIAAETLKLAGDDAMRAGIYDEAREAYLQALQEAPADPNILCNLSLAALKLGYPVEAAAHADQAIAELEAVAPSEAATAALAKAYHRKAQAQVACSELVQALKTYKAGLAACPGAAALAAAARLALDQAPASWFAAHCAHMVDAAQQPHPLSARDGKLLKLVPLQRRLAEADLRRALAAYLQGGERRMEECRDLLCAAWVEGRGLGRAEVAFYRAVAHWEVGDGEQAQRDSWVAATYGPKDASGASAWAAALTVHAATLEGKGDNVPALLHAARAAELDPDCPEAAAAVDRLLRRVLEHYAEAVRCGGAERLTAVLAAERERALPPFLRPKPKYYYYYEWMRRRIEGRHPELPEPLMDKLLTLDATELDLLLQYPEAVDETVAALAGVLEERGEEALASYTVPLLSWERKQALDEAAAARLTAAEAQARLEHAPRPAVRMLTSSAPTDTVSVEEAGASYGEEEGGTGGGGTASGALFALD